MPTARPRVLVVDDDETIRHVICEALEADGFEVRAAVNGRDGEEALALWRPAVIVLDMMMPEIDGWQFLADLRAGPLAQTPVLVVSGSYELHEKARPVDAAGVLSKPFDLDELLQRVATLCWPEAQPRSAG